VVLVFCFLGWYVPSGVILPMSWWFLWIVWFVCCSGFVLCRCSSGFLWFLVLGVCFVVVLFVGMLFVLFVERFSWG